MPQYSTAIQVKYKFTVIYKIMVIMTDNGGVKNVIVESILIIYSKSNSIMISSFLQDFDCTCI